MNITELLQKDLDTDPKHICVNITPPTDIYNLCFIEYEDHEKLGTYITGEDGRERYQIIYKPQIISIQVVYEQDINITTKKEDQDVMIQ